MPPPADRPTPPASTAAHTPTADQIAAAPKVVLHDHLDGGLRPATVVELAADLGYDGLPTTDADELAVWFTRGADRKSLELYLEGFSHTVAVMQTPQSLERVAYEAAADLAADGVVYAEIRFAPELHVDAGMDLDAVVEAVLTGFDRGMADFPITVGTLVTAMRHAAHSVEVAELAMRHRGSPDQPGVVGFDIAGAEAGYPPSRHLDAFQLIQRANSHVTIHAGEAFGLRSIWEALQFCNAERLGHGVRIVDDIAVAADGRAAEQAELGRLAAYVRDTRVPLEMCPTSNVNTGAAPSLAEHPIDLLKRLRFRVTVNTDNRLMSGVSMTSEMQAMVEVFGWTLADLRWVTINAMKSAFWPFDRRLALIDDVIKPGYAALGA